MNGTFDNEEWRAVPGYEGFYEISNLGRIRNIKKSHILNTYMQKNGYKAIVLCRNKMHKHWLVHRLVAQAFIPNPNNWPVINHINEIKDDNRVGNLEWCTRSYNSRYGNRVKKFLEHTNFSASTKNGLARAHKLALKPVLQFSLNGEFIKKWDSAHQYAKQFPDRPNMANGISKCCRGVIGTAYGYKWQYTERC